MRRVAGWILLLAGAWMMISPQALLGLEQLKGMADYAFPGEVLGGVVAISAAYYLLGFKAPLDKSAGEE